MFCKKVFLEPLRDETTYEIYLGIDGGNTPLIVYKCPCCGSEDIEEINMEDEDE
jgi:hypothetical protein